VGGAAGGARDAVADAVAAVDASPRATYADAVLASVALALDAGRAGDPAATSDALLRARALVARTEDRVHDALVTLAQAIIGAAPDAAVVAEDKLGALGIEAIGWRRLLARNPLAVG
jgi:hypothetical protein